MADNKTNLSSNDINLIRAALIDALKNGDNNTRDFLAAVRDGVSEQSKNLATVLKLIQTGLIDISKQGNVTKKVFQDLANNQINTSDDIIKILNKNKLIESGKLDRIKEFIDKSKAGNIELDLTTNPQFRSVVSVIKTLDSFGKKLQDTSNETAQMMSENVDVIDDMLEGLTLFHKQLEMLSSEYAKQGVLSDVLTVNIDNSVEASRELLTTASNYVDIMSGLELPSPDVDTLLKAYNKLKSNLGSDQISILDLEDVSFENAAKKLTAEFNNELQTINLTAKEIQDNLLAGVMAAQGFTTNFDEFGNSTGMSYLGIQVEDQKLVETLMGNFEYISSIFKDLAAYNNMILMTSKEHGDIEEEKLKFAKDIVAQHIEKGKLTEKELKTNEDILKYTDDYLTNIKKDIELSTDKEKLLFQIYSAATAINNVQKKSIELSNTELQLVSKYRDRLVTVSDTQEYISGQLNILSNQFGVFGQAILGTDRIINNLKNSTKLAFEAMQEDLFNPNNPKTWFEATDTYIKTFRKNFLGAVSITKLLFVGLAALGVAAYNVMSRVKDLSTELGISKSEAYTMYDSMMKMEGAAGNIAVTQDKIVQIQQKQLEKYGKVLDLTSQSSRELIEYSSLLSNAYGVAVDESYEMISIFKKLGADDRLANTLAASTLEAAELAKISPKIIAKDLIDGAEEVSMYFGNMPEQAAKAVVNIRRMGSNIKKVGEQMQSTWNIEKFMTDMYEVAQLTGSQINLSGVFEAGITGDAEQFQAALLDAVGSLEELNNYSPQAQKKLAESLGMSVGEMKSMVRLSEMNLDLTKEEQDALSSQLDKMGDITGMSKADLEAKAKQFAATDAINAAWNKITSTLARAFLPIMEVVSDLIVGLSPVIDLIGFGFKAIGLLIKPFIPFLKFMGQVLGEISTIITNIFKKFDTGIDKVENVFGGFGEGVKIIGSGLLLSTLFFSKWSSIGGLLLSVFKAPFKLLGGMVGMTGKLSGVFKKMLPENMTEAITGKHYKGGQFMPGGGRAPAGGATAGGLVQTIKEKVTGSGTIDIKQTIQDKLTGQLDKAKEMISGTFSKLGDTIKNGLDFLKDIAVKGVNIIVEPLKVIGAGIGDVFNSILSGIGKGLSSFSGKAIIGAVALGILGGAMWLMAQSMKVFNEVEWESIGKGIAALTAFSVAAGIIAGFAPVILAGSATIVALSVAMAALGGGIYLLSAGLTKLDDVAGQMIESINQLGNINASNLFSVAGGILAIGAAFAGFAALSMAGGIMSLFGGNPVSQFVELGKTAPAIALLATSFMMLVNALKDYIAISGNIPTANIKQIETISKDINTNLNSTQLKSDNKNTIPSVGPTLKELQVTDSSEKSTTVREKSMSSMGSTDRMEQLLQKLIMVVQESVNTPVPAILSDTQIPGLAKRIKTINNR